MKVLFSIGTNIADPVLISLILASFTNTITILYVALTTKTHFRLLYHNQVYFASRSYIFTYLMLMIDRFLLASTTNVEFRAFNAIKKTILTLAMTVRTHQSFLIDILLLFFNWIYFLKLLFFLLVALSFKIEFF
jgi:hypothetical protein